MDCRRRDVNYYVFGAGIWGRFTARHLINSGETVLAVIDNDVNKQGGEIDGASISSVDCLRDFDSDNCRIIIATDCRKFIYEITAQLTALGFRKYQDFFCPTMPSSHSSPSYKLDPPPFFTVRQSYDPLCLVFKNDEKRIFRFVPAEKADEYREIIKRLSAAGKGYLADTFISDIHFGQYPGSLMLEQEFLSSVSLVHHWPPEMVRDYVLWMLDFIAALDSVGLYLHDLHLRNATFVKGKFVFYDIGALRIGKLSAVLVHVLVEVYLNPIILMSAGAVTDAHGYYIKNGIPLCYDGIKGYLSDKLCAEYQTMLAAVEGACGNGDIETCCRLLQEFVKSLPPIVIISPWSDYSINDLLLIRTRQTDAVAKKYSATARWVDSYKPRTLIDLAGNKGILAFLLQDKVDYCLNLDIDLGALNTTWLAANSPEFKGKVPVVPVFLHILRASSDEIKQFRCEMAVALALLHHLVFTELLTFEQAITKLLQFTERYLVIEFVEPHDSAIINNGWAEKQGFDWYTAANFEEALMKHCYILDRQDTSGDMRSVYLCKVKENTIASEGGGLNG
jgi:hypothetical protein